MKERITQRPICVALVLFFAGFLLSAAGQREGRDSWQQPRRVIADLGLKPSDAVADIGCGQGYFTFLLAKAVGNTGRVYATEIDGKALKAVANRAEKEGLANIKTVLSDPTDTRLTSDSLNAALLVNVLHHVPKDKRLPLVKDIARALKPGGFLFVIDWRVDAEIEHDRDLRIPWDDLVNLAKDAGLTLDAEFHYLRNQVFFRCRKPTELK
jgi:predicted methyltransferase